MQPLTKAMKYERDGIGCQNHAHDPLNDVCSADSDDASDGAGEQQESVATAAAVWICSRRLTRELAVRRTTVSIAPGPANVGMARGGIASCIGAVASAPSTTLGLCWPITTM